MRIEACEQLDQPCASRRQREAVWAKHVALEEMAGKGEAGENIGRRGSGVVLKQEARELQQPVTVGLTGVAGNGPARSRRDIDQVCACPGRGALAEIKAEAEVLEQQKQLAALAGALALVEAAQQGEQPIPEA